MPDKVLPNCCMFPLISLIFPHHDFGIKSDHTGSCLYFNANRSHIQWLKGLGVCFSFTSSMNGGFWARDGKISALSNGFLLFSITVAFLTHGSQGHLGGYMCFSPRGCKKSERTTRAFFSVRPGSDVLCLPSPGRTQPPGSIWNTGPVLHPGLFLWGLTSGERISTFTVLEGLFPQCEFP